MTRLTFDRRSAVMLQFNAQSTAKRLCAGRAFRAMGTSAQEAALGRLGSDVIDYLTYSDAPKRKWPMSWWGRRPPLIERSYEGLDDIFLTAADYRGMGKTAALKKRGIRLVARPVNGPMVRGVGGTDGDVDIIFWRLDTEGWKVFFTAIDLNPDDPYTGCPPGVSLMPQVSPDNNFLEPLNFC